MREHQVAVLGASGHTGRFVVEALRQQGATAIPATRSGRFAALSGAVEDCRVLEFSRPGELDRAIAGAHCVINCAGPFFDTALPAAEAALSAGIPYLDLTAEQVTALSLFERLDAPARRAGVAIVPAMAFFGGLADLLATALAQSCSEIEAVDIAVGLDSWRPTHGTRLTGARNIYPRLIVREGRLTPVPTPPPSGHWSFPQPFGEQPVTCVALSEVILISRHLSAASVTSYMNLKPLEDLQDPSTPPPQPADEQGRSGQAFVVDVRLTANGMEHRATATGRDIYAVSATMIVQACLLILGGMPANPGVRAPGGLFSPREFLAKLDRDLDVTWQA